MRIHLSLLYSLPQKVKRSPLEINVPRIRFFSFLKVSPFRNYSKCSTYSCYDSYSPLKVKVSPFNNFSFSIFSKVKVSPLEIYNSYFPLKVKVSPFTNFSLSIFSKVKVSPLESYSPLKVNVSPFNNFSFSIFSKVKVSPLDKLYKRKRPFSQCHALKPLPKK